MVVTHQSILTVHEALEMARISLVISFAVFIVVFLVEVAEKRTLRRSADLALIPFILCFIITIVAQMNR
ncbi:MAG: hypothetical protein AAB472_03010 [Patescibacteria group bacterium]